jgi:SPP1 gp7 family putative phage head morphogenesis protein
MCQVCASRRAERAIRLVAALRASEAYKAGKAAEDLVWSAIEATRRELEQEVLQATVALFARMARDVAERATRAIKTTVNWDDLYPEALWTQETMRVLGPFVWAGVARGYEMGVLNARWNGVMDATRQGVIDAAGRVLAKARSIPTTTLEDMRRTLLQGIERGESTEALASRIQAVFTDTTASRARTIAQTTAVSAFETGQQLAFQDAGITRHRWLSQRDERVRESHQIVDGEEVEIGQPFSNGLLYPGDPSGSAAEVINCRCSVLPLLPDETKDWRALRDRSIRHDYKSLLPEHGQLAALDLLAERYTCSVSTVKRALWPKKA